MRRLRTRLDGQAGAAAVELAFVLPVLLLMLFGIIEFGRAFNTKLAVTHAAREGVRLAAVDNAGAAAAAQDQAPDGSTVVVSACGGGDDQASVTVSKDVDIEIPLVPLAGGPTFTMSATAVMTCR